MPLKTALIIRADASISIGTGHIMRMIALSQTWLSEGGEVYFLCAQLTPALEQRLAREAFHLIRIDALPGGQDDLCETIRLISKTLQVDREKSRVVIDGYHFGADYQLGIKAAGLKLLVVDEYGHADFYHGDWVLNQNISAREDLYKKRNLETKLLLGSKYAMLRKEFLAFKNWHREISPVDKNILVTMGGSDPDNVTLKVIQTLIDLDLHIKVVVGGSNPHLRNIRDFIQTEKHSVALIEVINNAISMPELMAWADVAIIAGGSTCWEAAFMGLPSIVFIFVENQKEIAFAIENTGLGINLGWANEESYKKLKNVLINFLSNPIHRKSVSELGKKLIDGMGCLQIYKLINR
jgi:UDP-2,4-diacetamido-2,4,6-trideoxy-beta-L-altropyranose hydrolase